ncbi:MAG: FkbM family methyltransferase [Caldimonas sp.]
MDLAMAERVVSLSRRHSAFRGGKMAIFANDLIGAYINQFGVYEKEELDILMEFLAPLHDTFRQGTCLDIGANIGNHSLFFARYFSRIEAFEPNPATYQLLSFNVGRVVNIFPHPVGLGAEGGSFHMREDPGNLGGSRIDEQDTSGSIDIQVERLDDIGLDLSALCFIKMDVEGFEASVIKGGVRTIETHHPLIVLEQHESEFADGSTESIALLERMGYRFCWHCAGSRARNLILRRLHNVRELFAGRTHQILTGQKVPKQNHPMLIAAPERYWKALRLPFAASATSSATSR